MFALEISFRDGVSQSEMLFVRRPQALIGASDYAHVVIEDLKAINLQLKLIRGIGRKFSCKPLGNYEAIGLGWLSESEFDGDTSIDVGPVRFHCTALDLDLLLKETEPPDRAGVRVLRQACTQPSPRIPAIVVGGSAPMVISFAPDQTIYIGRSNQCIVRLDAADVSAKHARMGFEDNAFWIEDLGSTNGTYVQGTQISGKVQLSPNTSVVVGREISLCGIVDSSEIERVNRIAPSAVSANLQEVRYPTLVSVSEVARPARVVLSPDLTVSIGRDPTSELWLGAPHVSRRHCTVAMGREGEITVTDHSTNGTAYDGGILRKGETLLWNQDPHVLDFGGGITVAVCFSEEDEKAFVAALGGVQVFRNGASAAPNPGKSRDERSQELDLDVIERRPDQDDEERMPLFQELLAFYQSLKLFGKLLLLLTVMVVSTVVFVMLSLLAGFVH